MKKKIVFGMCVTCLLASMLFGCGKEAEFGSGNQNDAGQSRQEDAGEDLSEINKDLNAKSIDELEKKNTGGDGEKVEFELKEVIEGDKAIDITVELVDGSAFTLSDNSGKVILLNFWATWCGPCVGEMPALQDLDDEYGEEVVILAVNSMEDKETVKQFVQDSGYTFPIAYDVEGLASLTYPSSGIPYTLIIGKDGIVKKTYVGAADADTQYGIYKDAIDAALAE